MFGSDYPYMPPSRWLQEFEELEMRDGPRQKILLGQRKARAGFVGGAATGFATSLRNFHRVDATLAQQ